MTRKETLAEGVTLYLGDCRDVLPTLGKVDAVITDPPYPGVFEDEYKFDHDILPSLNIERGIVFWNTEYTFPIPWSSIHIWDKKISIGRDYEIIYEIGGNRERCVFRHYLLNSSVAAMMAREELNGHPSQKPICLLIDCISRVKGSICDPFMGSGTTGVAAVKLGRQFIGIEINETYFDIACSRIEDALKRPDLFIPAPAPKAKQESLL